MEVFGLGTTKSLTAEPVHMQTRLSACNYEAAALHSLSLLKHMRRFCHRDKLDRL